MGSGITRPRAFDDDLQYHGKDIVDERTSRRHHDFGAASSSSAANVSEIFKVSSTMLRVEDMDKQFNRRTSHIDGDSGDYEHIIMGAVSNDTIRRLLRSELKTGAFANFIKSGRLPRTYSELLTHVMNIEKCKRSLKDPDFVHEEFLRLFEHYKRRSVKHTESGELSHPSVLIFKTLRQKRTEADELPPPIDSMSIDDMRKQMLKSQEEILGLLAPTLSEFLLSDSFMETFAVDDETADGGNSFDHSSPTCQEFRRFRKHGKTHPNTIELESNVNGILMSRFHDAKLTGFDLEIVSPVITPPPRLSLASSGGADVPSPSSSTSRRRSGRHRRSSDESPAEAT